MLGCRELRPSRLVAAPRHFSFLVCKMGRMTPKLPLSNGCYKNRIDVEAYCKPHGASHGQTEDPSRRPNMRVESEWKASPSRGPARERTLQKYMGSIFIYIYSCSCACGYTGTYMCAHIGRAWIDLHHLSIIYNLLRKI